MLAYALLRKQWVTPLDSWQKIGLYALSQRVGDIARDPALMRGYSLLKRWHETATGARVRAYRIVRK